MMNIDLSRFLDQTTTSLHFDETLEFDRIEINGRKIIFTEAINVIGDIYKVEGSDYLSGRVHFKYIENCARCLKEFTQEVSAVLSGKLIEKSQAEDFDDENEDAIYYEGSSIDLKDLIINTIILSIPMKALCSEDCKGLCSKCGKNLNEGNCDCVIEDVDPRLAKLKEFFK